MKNIIFDFSVTLEQPTSIDLPTENSLVSEESEDDCRDLDNTEAESEKLDDFEAQYSKLNIVARRKRAISKLRVSIHFSKLVT